MTSEQLPRHQNVLFAIETQDYYGKVATNALRPQTRLRQLVQRQDMWSWPQRGIREQDAPTQPLKQMRLVRIDVQVSHLYLRARPGHPRFTFKDIRVAIFFRQRDRMVARLCYPGRENNFRIAGQLDLTRTRGVIRDRNSPHLGVVLGRDDHFEVGDDAEVPAPEVGLVFGKRDFVFLRFAADGLVSR